MATRTEADVHGRRELDRAVADVVSCVRVFGDRWGAAAALKLCVVLRKIVMWGLEFGTGGVEANARAHVFSEKVTTRTYQ
jgi:hypothetical protein